MSYFTNTDLPQFTQLTWIHLFFFGRPTRMTICCACKSDRILFWRRGQPNLSLRNNVTSRWVNSESKASTLEIRLYMPTTQGNTATLL